MDYIYFVSAHCYCCGEQFIHASQSTIIIFFAFIVFNPNLKRLLAAKMLGLLWWHQFDGLGMTSLTTPLQLSVLISEWNAYFATSNQFAVEKNKPCPLFSSFNILFLSELRHNTQEKTVANFRFTQTSTQHFLECTHAKENTQNTQTTS